jgi:hypothetical protein
MFKIIPDKKKKGLCVAYACKNKHSVRDRFCSKHSKRYQKHANPYNYVYGQKKFRALERGIKWNISLDEFIDFCEKTNYLALKGKSADSASIDRIDPNKGYEVGNIQILTLSENTKKMHADNSANEDLPF